MKNFKTLIGFLLLILLFPDVTAQELQDCQVDLSLQKLDQPKNIPGETFGQKLESLLFWTQDEKERRFAKMHAIYPSHLVKSGADVLWLNKIEAIAPKWEDETNLQSYMADNHVKGMIVLQNNTILLEEYAEDVNENTLWTSFSVAKSISSMLLGAALKDGAIKSLDDRLDEYISEFKGEDYGQVTVRQLLTMTSGIAWNEDYTDENSDVAQMYLKPCEGKEAHILTYMKSLKSVANPGEKWNYSTGETDLLGILIQKATGKSLAEYLSEKIWIPWGMESCAYWLADECSELNIGGSGLSATLRDYARLGTVMLNNSELYGEKLLADEWLENATEMLFKTGEGDGGYGYLWWKAGNGSYLAVGIFGQMIYINPAKNLVIAQYAAWSSAGSKELSNNRSDFIQAVERSVQNP